MTLADAILNEEEVEAKYRENPDEIISVEMTRIDLHWIIKLIKELKHDTNRFGDA